MRRERVAAEAKLHRLYVMVEDEITSPRDPVFAGRVSELQGTITQLGASERSLTAQLQKGERRIDEAAVEQFGKLVRSRMLADSDFRRGYTRLFVGNVTVTDERISISGTPVALEAALAYGDRTGLPPVLRFDREWCPGEDSNLHALASAST